GLVSLAGAKADGEELAPGVVQEREVHAIDQGAGPRRESLERGQAGGQAGSPRSLGGVARRLLLQRLRQLAPPVEGLARWTGSWLTIQHGERSAKRLCVGHQQA